MKLTFYMTSGNKFTINNVVTWKFTDRNGQLSGVYIEQRFNSWLRPFSKTDRLIVKTIRLESIEAVVEH